MKYSGIRNPDTTTPQEFFREPEAGTNCQLLVVTLAQAMGRELPSLRSAELFADTQFTEFVPDLSLARTGDIIGLAREEKTDPKWFHVGILSFNEEGEPLISHNARHVGFAQTEMLSDAMQHPLHRIIAGIKRPIVESPDGPKIDFLLEYGFEHLAA